MANKFLAVLFILLIVVSKGTLLDAGQNSMSIEVTSSEHTLSSAPQDSFNPITLSDDPNSFSERVPGLNDFVQHEYLPAVVVNVSGDAPDERYVTDEKYGKVYPCALLGAFELQKNQKTVYFNNSDEGLDEAYQPNGDESMLVYGGEKLIGRATLIEQTGYLKDKENWYHGRWGIVFTDQTIELKQGYYVAINNPQNAVPRAVIQTDKVGSLNVDLEGSGKTDDLCFYTDDDGYGNQALFLNASIEGTDTKLLVGPLHVENPLVDIYGEPPPQSFIQVYDLDGDGIMEIIVFSFWDGGDVYTIYSLKDHVPTSVIGYDTGD